MHAMSSPHSPPRTAAAGGEYYVRPYAATGAVAGWVMTVFPFEFSTLSRVECGPIPRVDRELRGPGASVLCSK